MQFPEDHGGEDGDGPLAAKKVEAAAGPVYQGVKIPMDWQLLMLAWCSGSCSGAIGSAYLPAIIVAAPP